MFSYVKVKGYRLWVRKIKWHKIIISRNAVFIEDNLPYLKTQKKCEPVS